MITERQIKAKDIKRLLLRVYRRYQSGAITEAQATKETYLLNSLLKTVDINKEETFFKVILPRKLR
jgi:hypothetical protein